MTAVMYIVFARLDSSRFPGKVLCRLQGVPLLDGIITRLRLAGAGDDEICVATTDRAVDDRLSDHCIERGYRVFRGDESDVCARALGAADTRGAGAFFRVNGDSPFVNERLLADARRLREAGGHAFITNIPGRTWPYGVSCELVDTAALRAFHRRGLTASQREHVTAVLYDHLDSLDHVVLERKAASTKPLRLERLTIDESGDLERIERVCGELGIDWTADPFDSIIEKLETTQ